MKKKSNTDSLTRLALWLTIFLAGSGFCESIRAANVLQVGYASGRPGEDRVHMIVTATNDEPIHGYSLALTAPSAALQPTALGVCGTHPVEHEPEFVAPQINNELGIAQLVVIIEFEAPTGENYLEPLAAQDW